MFRVRTTKWLTLAVFVMFSVSGLASDDKALEKEKNKAAVFPAAIEVRRPVDEVLHCFGEMVAAYGAASGQGPNIIGIDFVSKVAPSDKLPDDQGQYARDVLEKIGQFQTFRTLPAGFDSARSAVLALPQLLQARPNPPLTYRLVGSIVGLNAVVVKGQNRRADASFGRGSTPTDAGITRDRARILTALSLALTLESPSGLGVPGATAEYRIYLEENERNHGLSFYIGGNGIGLGSRLKVTQDPADALYNVMAMNLVHVLGNALRVPYHLCSSSFPPDQALEERVRDSFTRVTQSQLEQQLKRYMIVAGFGMDRSRAELSDADRAVVTAEMRLRKLEAHDRIATVELLMQFWRSGLDYHKAAKRVSVLLADSEWRQREALEKQAREQASLAVSPAEFGWPASARIAVIDLARVKNPLMQNQILSALRRCIGCGEIRKHPQNELLGISVSSKLSQIQYALSSASLHLEYVWFNNRLLVVPPADVAQSTTALSNK